MEPKKKALVVNESLVVDESRDENTEKEVETESFEILSKNGLVDQLIAKITSMPAEIRTQFDYSIAGQGSGIKVHRSGEIEATAPKVLLKITPKPH